MNKPTERGRRYIKKSCMILPRRERAILEGTKKIQGTMMVQRWTVKRKLWDFTGGNFSTPTSAARILASPADDQHHKTASCASATGPASPRACWPAARSGEERSHCTPAPQPPSPPPTHRKGEGGTTMAPCADEQAIATPSEQTRQHC